MEIYNIGYYTYEESDYAQLYHEKKFTKKELDEIIFKASLSVIKKKMVLNHFIHNYSDIHSDVISVLCDNYGFKEVEYDMSWTCFGWASIFDNKDWESDRDNNLKNLTKYLNKAKFNRNHDSMRK